MMLRRALSAPLMPRRLSARAAPLLALVLLAACAGSPAANRPAASARPASPIIRVPQMMQAAGMENIIGVSASALTRRLGEPRLDVVEGDVRKLQFAGSSCVMDIYLYPLQAGGEPVATHIEARLRQGGAPADRRQCLRELER